MSACDRFEREGLLRLEQGLPLDPHFAECPECLAARAAYESLARRLSALGPEDQPLVGWEERVQRALAVPPEPRRLRPRWWVTVPASALAVGLLVVSGTRLVRPPAAALTVSTRERAGAAYRGEPLRLGQVVVMDAQTGGAAQAELRVYREDREIVLRCSTEPPCHRVGRRIQAELRPEAIGQYQPVLLLSSRALPPPRGTLDQDGDAVLGAGGQFLLGSELEVR